MEGLRENLMGNPEVAAEVERLQPEYEIISQIIRARNAQKLSQSQLAAKCGTRQSNICRLESGSYNPSLQFLKKVAHGLGKEIHISLTNPAKPAGCRESGKAVAKATGQKSVIRVESKSE